MSVSTTSRIVTALRELISALDRRVPHLERPDDKPYDPELVEAIMTDDGWPSPESETNTRSSGGRSNSPPEIGMPALANAKRG